MSLTYREIDGRTATTEEWDAIEKVLAARGWMSLNRETTPKILLIEDDTHIVGFFVVQFVPHAGPMYVERGYRGTHVPNLLAAKMRDFLVASEARGVVIVADNPVTVKMCEAAQMHRVPSPVFVVAGAEV